MSSLRAAVHRCLTWFFRNHYYLLPKHRVTYSHDLLFTFHSAPFLRDYRFRQAYRHGKEADAGSLLANADIEWRVHVLCWAATQALRLEGDFVECGVHRGMYARAIIAYTGFPPEGRGYWLLDTFRGLDQRYCSAAEFERNRTMGYDERGDIYDSVRNSFADCAAVHVVRGPIPDTLPLVTAEKLAFLSIDMNCVQPEVAALEYFWDRLVPGGIIVLDDYGYADAHAEQQAAHDRFARSKGVEVLCLPTCQGVIIKP